MDARKKGTRAAAKKEQIILNLFTFFISNILIGYNIIVRTEPIVQATCAFVKLMEPKGAAPKVLNGKPAIVNKTRTRKSSHSVLPAHLIGLLNRPVFSSHLS